MTIREAIDRIDLMRQKYPFLSVIDAEALDMAVSALEKQDGEKPLNTDEYHPYYGCPSCGHIVSVVQDCCESCGQKIDWSEHDSE